MRRIRKERVAETTLDNRCLESGVKSGSEARGDQWERAARILSGVCAVVPIALALLLLVSRPLLPFPSPPTSLHAEFFVQLVEIPVVRPPPTELAAPAAPAFVQPDRQSTERRAANEPQPERADVSGEQTRVEVDVAGWAASLHAVEFEDDSFLSRGQAEGFRSDTFRMRRAVSGRDIVRGFSALAGLWPPGYTDDPCPMLRTTVEQIYNSDAPRDAAFMQDALAARDQFCS